MAIYTWKLMVVVALTGCDTWGFREPGAAIDGAYDGGMFRFSFRECGRRQSFSPRHVAVAAPALTKGRAGITFLRSA